MTTGDQKTFSQIMKQTGKLVETKTIFSVEPYSTFIRELLLVKISLADADEKAIEEQALADSKVQAAMTGMKVVKAIVIKKKIVNFVVKPE